MTSYHLKAFELSEISRLLTNFKTDKEIMRDLNIPKRTYYRYKSKLLAESAEHFKNQKLEDVALYKDLLNDRLTHFLGLLDDKIQRSIDVRDTMNPTKDLTGLFNCAKDMSIAIFQLNTQGIEAVNHMKSIAEHAVNDGSNEIREAIEIGLLSSFEGKTDNNNKRS
jgi:hypothetical protein